MEIKLTWPQVHQARMLLAELLKVERTNAGELEIVKGGSKVTWEVEGVVLTIEDLIYTKPERG